jgi:dipeptidyl aminopeptidase/acylaminoacyl peptidase
VTAHLASARALARGATFGAPALGRHLVAWPVLQHGRADIVVPIGGDDNDPLAWSTRIATPDVPVSSSVSRGVVACAWAPGAQLVYVGADGRLLVVTAHPGFAAGPPRTLDDGRAACPAVSPDGRFVAYAVERGDVADIAVVPVDGSAWPVRITAGVDWCWDPAWSADGTELVWHEWDEPDMPWDASRVVRRAFDGRGPMGDVVTVAGGDGVATGQPRFSPDGSRLGWVSDATGWMNVWVAAVDGSGARPLLGLDGEPREHAEPSWGPGQRSWCWSPDGTAIVLCRNEDGFGRLVHVRVDDGVEIGLSKGWHRGLAWADRRPLSGGAHPGGDQHDVWAVRSGGATPHQVVSLVPPSPADALHRRVVAHGGVVGVEAGAVEPRAVTWTADDGATVHGLLYTPGTGPDGPAADPHRPHTAPPEPGPPPMLVWCHGGPTGQAIVDWSNRIRYLTDRGWAVLQPNPRGSTGYGRAYAQALRGRWGELDVADVVAGIRHAGRAGWCDPRRVAVGGGSAGGFVALLVAAADPPVVRAVVSAYGVADLFRLAETTHRFERRYVDALCGGLPAHAATWRERSPVHRASDIRVPLLVLQGAVDKVVPREQADLLAAAVRRRGVDVELHVYDGEGHGWSRPATVTDDLERVEAFLARHVLRR